MAETKNTKMPELVAKTLQNTGNCKNANAMETTAACWADVSMLYRS